MASLRKPRGVPRDEWRLAQALAATGGAGRRPEEARPRAEYIARQFGTNLGSAAYCGAFAQLTDAESGYMRRHKGGEAYTLGAALAEATTS